jgi:hypothetical protein
MMEGLWAHTLNISENSETELLRKADQGFAARNILTPVKYDLASPLLLGSC